MLKHRKYAIGEPVLIYVGDHSGERTEGRVVHEFTLQDWNMPLYVISIDTSLDPLLEVRSGSALEMRPSSGSIEYESWARK